MGNVYSEQNYLNLMIKKDPNQLNYKYYSSARAHHLNRSKEAQFNILKAAKIAADNRANPGTISEKDRQKAAKHAGASDLLKVKALIEKQGALVLEEQEANDKQDFLLSFATIMVLLALLSTAFMPFIIVNPLLALVPVSLFVVGTALMIAGLTTDLKNTNSVQLLNKLKRLDPDFLRDLDSESKPELPIGPEPTAGAEGQTKMDIQPSAPPLELLPKTEPKADPDPKAAKTPRNSL